MIYKRFPQHTININGASIRPPVSPLLKAELQAEHIEHLTLVAWPKGSSLEFLKEMEFIKGIYISLEGPIDISPINSLSKLEYFQSDNNRIIGKIDFKNFPDLKFLNFGYSDKVFENFSSLKNLVKLTINNWPFENLTGLAQLDKLEVLKLDFAKKLQTLAGIEKLKHLDFVEIYSAPKLTDVSDLKANAGTLKRLAFELVNNVTDFKVLDDLGRLERFYIYRSAPLHSVQFLKKLQNLNYAYIGTEVLDGDVEILKEKKIEYKKLKKYLL